MLAKSRFVRARLRGDLIREHAMNPPEQRSVGPAFATIVALAVVLALLGYFATRILDGDVSGSGNAQVGLSAAVVAGIACVSAAVGAVIVWSGRSRPKGNARIAAVATIVIAVLLLLIAFAAGTSSTEPASVPGPLSNSQ